MQLKTKIFRLKARNNIEEARSLYRCAIECLCEKEQTDVLVNTFLNITENFLSEFSGDSPQLCEEDRVTFSGLTRQSH
jgi:hypothetical protein